MYQVSVEVYHDTYIVDQEWYTAAPLKCPPKCVVLKLLYLIIRVPHTSIEKHDPCWVELCKNQALCLLNIYLANLCFIYYDHHQVQSNLRTNVYPSFHYIIYTYVCYKISIFLSMKMYCVPNTVLSFMKEFYWCIKMFWLLCLCYLCNWGFWQGSDRGIWQGLTDHAGDSDECFEVIPSNTILIL